MGKIKIDGHGTFEVDDRFFELPNDQQQQVLQEIIGAQSTYKPQDQEQSWGEWLDEKDVLQTVGSTIGGIGGAVLGTAAGPVGTIGGGAIGSGAGGALGEWLEQKISGRDARYEDTVLQAGLTDTAFGLAGGALGSVASKAGRRLIGDSVTNLPVVRALKNSPVAASVINSISGQVGKLSSKEGVDIVSKVTTPIAKEVDNALRALDSKIAKSDVKVTNTFVKNIDEIPVEEATDIVSKLGNPVTKAIDDKLANLTKVIDDGIKRNKKPTPDIPDTGLLGDIAEAGAKKPKVKLSDKVDELTDEETFSLLKELKEPVVDSLKERLSAYEKLMHSDTGFWYVNKKGQRIYDGYLTRAQGKEYAKIRDIFEDINKLQSQGTFGNSKDSLRILAEADELLGLNLSSKYAPDRFLTGKGVKKTKVKKDLIPLDPIEENAKNYLTKSQAKEFKKLKGIKEDLSRISDQDIKGGSKDALKLLAEADNLMGTNLVSKYAPGKFSSKSAKEALSSAEFSRYKKLSGIYDDIVKQNINFLESMYGGSNNNKVIKDIFDTLNKADGVLGTNHLKKFISDYSKGQLKRAVVPGLLAAEGAQQGINAFADSGYNQGGQVGRPRLNPRGVPYDRQYRDQKEVLLGVADILPIIGDARSMKAAYDAYQRGEKLEAASEVALMAAGWIPLVGPLAKVAKRIEIDPNTLGTLGGNVRLKTTDNPLDALMKRNLEEGKIDTGWNYQGLPQKDWDARYAGVQRDTDATHYLTDAERNTYYREGRGQGAQRKIEENQEFAGLASPMELDIANEILDRMKNPGNKTNSMIIDDVLEKYSTSDGSLSNIANVIAEKTGRKKADVYRELVRSKDAYKAQGGLLV